MRMNFSETLKQLRINAGYTQKQVYEMIGVPQSTFSSWEIGKSEPSADTLLHLCQIYGVEDVLTAFGYDGYKEDGSLQLNMYEIDIIEKYRELDAHGKEMVDFTLEKEFERSTAESKIVPISPVPGIKAAHERTDIDVTDEMRKHDDDIMSNENF